MQEFLINNNLNKQMKVAVVGATGLVGTKMLQVLAERNFPVTELIPVASEKSIGKEITFKGKQFKVVSVEDAIKTEARTLPYFQRRRKHFIGSRRRFSRPPAQPLLITHRPGAWIQPKNWLYPKLMPMY